MELLLLFTVSQLTATNYTNDFSNDRKLCNSCMVKIYVLKLSRKVFANESIFFPIRDDRVIVLKVIGERSHDTDDKSGREYAYGTADQP